MLVAQSCLTLCDLMDCSPPGFSVHGIFQARILAWVVIPFSMRSSQPRDWTWVSCIGSRFFTVWATREAPGSPGESLKVPQCPFCTPDNLTKFFRGGTQVSAFFKSQVDFQCGAKMENHCSKKVKIPTMKSQPSSNQIPPSTKPFKQLGRIFKPSCKLILLQSDKPQACCSLRSKFCPKAKGRQR